MLKIVVVLGLMLAGVLAQNYQAAVPIASQSYKAQPSAPIKEDFGPDTSNFQYQVPVYDPKTYAKADVNVNRFPGGANYQLDENGQGSNFKLTYEHSGTGKKVKAPGSPY